jgi:hypothetical protein
MYGNVRISTVQNYRSEQFQINQLPRFSPSQLHKREGAISAHIAARNKIKHYAHELSYHLSDVAPNKKKHTTSLFTFLLTIPTPTITNVAEI